MPEPEPGKPPYRVPSMAEVEATPWNGLTVASTFAGGGGSCTGYRMAGYRVLWANEFEPAAAETYAANHPATVLDRRDIRTLAGAGVVEACGGVPDVLDGSPPCQSFSMAGQRQRSWGRVMDHADGTTQRSDDLFFEYARLLGEVRPRAFVAENVAGLVAGAAKGYFKEIVRALRGQGYVVAAKVLDAQWLGVPQARRRVIIVGLRDDLGLAPAFPKPWPFRYSVAEACPWIVRMGYDGGSGYRKGTKEVVEAAEAPSPAVEAAGIFNDSRTGRDKYWIEAQPSLKTGHEERSVDEPAPTVQANPREFGLAAKQARIADPAEPCPTILAADGGWSDVSVERRKLTIPEVVRICSFPDDYRLAGSYAQQWARLGNSVPPLMMRAVAEALATVLAPATG